MLTKYILSPHRQIVLFSLWWGNLEGAIKTIIGTKTDFNTGSISMYEIVIKFYISNDSFKYNLLSFVIYDIVQNSLAS
jgi:hypothetical protein